MNRKLGLGIAAATLTSGLIYLYKREGRTKKESRSPVAAVTRKRTDAFAKAKPRKGPAL